MKQIDKTALDEVIKRMYECNHDNDWQYKKDVDLIAKAAQAYRDLPEKIEGMKWSMDGNEYDEGVRGYNQALDDILNLLKTEEK